MLIGRLLRAGSGSALLRHARELAISANTLKNGSFITGSSIGSKADRILQVTECRPGKQGGQGQAFFLAKLKDFNTGAMLTHKFRPDDAVEIVELGNAVSYQYLYQSPGTLHLMEMETFDEVELPESVLGDQLQWLVDGMDVKVRMLDGAPISASLPEKVELTVVEAGASTKKGKSGDSHKSVRLSNGAMLRVPHFVNEGDTVVVRTQDGEYDTKL